MAKITKEAEITVYMDDFSDADILHQAKVILRDDNDKAQEFIKEFVLEPEEIEQPFTPQNLREEQEFEEFIERMNNKRKAL